MRFKILTYVPLTRALRHGLSVPRKGFGWFVPGIGSLPSLGIIGDTEAEGPAGGRKLSALQTAFATLLQYTYQYQYVGFEHVQRPLFIDPVCTELVRIAHPEVFNLRERWLTDWRVSYLPTQGASESYWNMRAGFTESDLTAIANWLDRVDVVVPGQGSFLPTRQTELFQRFNVQWPDWIHTVRQTPLFKNLLEAEVTNVTLLCQTGSFIIRSDLFRDFALALLDLFDHFLSKALDIGADVFMSFVERLFAIYFRQLSLENALLRVERTPLLVDTPASAPLQVPVDFDADSYLRCNPDVDIAGIDAARHYLRHGWREGRDWVQL